MILYDADTLSARVKELGKEVETFYRGKDPLVVCVLKGAVIFFSDLIRNISYVLDIDFIRVSTYGTGSASSGDLKIKKDVESDVKGRDVLLVEDILDSGYTLYCLKQLLLERGAASVRVVTLLNKRGRREYDIRPEWRGFDVGGEFVVGYGLDYAERYRNLPYVAILDPAVYRKG